jgi:hypothetical protein
MVYFIDSVECQNNANRIGTVMVSLLASSVVDLLDEYAIVSVGSFQRLYNSYVLLLRYARNNNE